MTISIAIKRAQTKANTINKICQGNVSDYVVVLSVFVSFLFVELSIGVIVEAYTFLQDV